MWPDGIGVLMMALKTLNYFFMVKPQDQVVNTYTHLSKMLKVELLMMF